MLRNARYLYLKQLFFYRISISNWLWVPEFVLRLATRHHKIRDLTFTVSSTVNMTDRARCLEQSVLPEFRVIHSPRGHCHSTPHPPIFWHIIGRLEAFHLFFSPFVPLGRSVENLFDLGHSRITGQFYVYI